MFACVRIRARVRRRLLLLTCHVFCIPQRDVRYLSHRIAKKAAAALAAAPPPPAASDGTSPATATAAPTLATADKNRPALSGSADFGTIMALRAPWYEAAAHVVIEGCDPKDGAPRPKEALTAEVLRAFWARAEGSNGGASGRRGGGKGEVREMCAKQAAGVAALTTYLIG